MITETNLNGYNDSRYFFAAKKEDFEPFYSGWNGREHKPEPTNHRFINRYDGPYTQNMFLNRKAVEKFIKLGGLQGTITLGQLPNFPQRIEEKVNPDGSVTTTKVDILNNGHTSPSLEEENPHYRVTSTYDGWNININGKRINDEISRNPPKSMSNEELFTRRFNGFLYNSLRNCLEREKWSDEKNPFFSKQLIFTILPPLSGYLTYSIGKLSLIDNQNYSLPNDSAIVLGLTIMSWTLLNTAWLIIAQNNLDNEDYLKWSRSPKEIMFPPVKIEGYLLGEVYLALKGRELVKLKS